MDARATARWTLLAPVVGILLYYVLMNLALWGQPRGDVGLALVVVFLGFALMASGVPAALWIWLVPGRLRRLAAAWLVMVGLAGAVVGSILLASAGDHLVAWALGAALWGWAVAQWYLAFAALTPWKPPPERSAMQRPA